MEPPYRNVAWSDALEKTPAAIALTIEGAARVDLWLRQFATIRPLTLPLLEGFHRTIFEEVFPDLAGRLRGEAPRYIPQNVEFGVRDDGKGIPGTRYEHVVQSCEGLFRRVPSLVTRMDAIMPTEPRNFPLSVLRVAAYVHCEIIKIHPFMNGNGRSARMCVNYFAYRYGFQPLSYERPSEGSGYIDAITAYLNDTRGGNQAADAFAAFLRPRLIRLASDVLQ
ncbi:MAG: Fic family protein [Thermomicrobiales bacterium]